MPKRPRQHQLETESRLAFERALGGRFVYRTEVPDYGVDGGVEEFDEHDQGTGLRYLVQLKGTDETGDKALKRSIKMDRATYYRSLPLPVLMVRYVAAENGLFARWFHDFPGPGEAPPEGAESLTFRWSADDEFDTGTSARLAAEARNVLGLRSSAPPLPFPFGLDVQDPPFGLTASELGIVLAREAQRRGDVIDLRTDAPEGSGRFRIDGLYVAVDLPGTTAASYDLAEDYDPGPGGRQLAIDLLTLAGIGFARWGQADASSRIGAGFFAESTLATRMEAAMIFAGEMSRSRRLHEALSVAEALDELDDPEIPSFLFTLPTLLNSESLTERELDEFRAVMRRRIERQKAAGKSVGAARESVSLGNHYRSVGEPGPAVELYEEARELDPGYQEREHYWGELAGVLFLAGRYAESADAYQRSRELGGDRFSSLLRADALMFAGR